jgi:hypothetical protein
MSWPPWAPRFLVQFINSLLLWRLGFQELIHLRSVLGVSITWGYSEQPLLASDACVFSSQLPSLCLSFSSGHINNGSCDLDSSLVESWSGERWSKCGFLSGLLCYDYTSLFFAGQDDDKDTGAEEQAAEGVVEHIHGYTYSSLTPL